MLRMRLWQIAVCFLLTVCEVVQCSCYKNLTNSQRFLSVDGVVGNITLHWGSDPGRAAAALFSVLAAKCGYQKIYLEKGPLDLEELDASPSNPVLALAASWKPAQLKPRGERGYYGLAGVNMDNIGASNVPANQQLHLHLAHQFSNKLECSNVNLWKFYEDVNALKNCGFVSDAGVYDGGYIYTLMSNNESIADILKIRVKSSPARLKFWKITRADLFQKLNEDTQSFLFVDYDIWKNHSGVRAVQLPPCKPDKLSTCQQELDTAFSIRAASPYLLEIYAPSLLKLAYDFRPSLKSIRAILELEANGAEIKDAALTWTSQNDCMIHNCERIERDITVFSCEDDPQLNDYTQLIDNLNINKIVNSEIKIALEMLTYNCSDSLYIRRDFLISRPVSKLMGLILNSVKDITNVGIGLEDQHVPILLNDASAVDVIDLQYVWVTNGHSLHLALALRHFFQKMGWTRVGIISEDTSTAKSFVNSLKNVHRNEKGENYFVFQDHIVKSNLNSEDARLVLQQLYDEYATIIYLNTNYEDAFTILSEAVKLKMNRTDEYAWIARDWQPYNRKLNITLFTTSFWSRSRNVSSTEQIVRPGLHEVLDGLWPSRSWPPHVVALTNAILTLVDAVTAAIHKYPSIEFDFGNKPFIRSIESSFTDASVTGIRQNLTYRNHSLETALVFLDEWQNGIPKLIEQWSVNATSKRCIVKHKYSNAFSGNKPPRTGVGPCIVPQDNSYNPRCNDFIWIPLLVGLILAIPTILWVVDRILKHFRQRQKEIMLELVMRHQRVTGLSTDYLMNRSAVELRYVLGSGRFGCVWQALLRVPNSPPQYVAAKELYDNEDEDKILQEACILASLNHQHIIRFIGVCVDTESPLVLTEVAFYGNLRQYLRMRRYLAESLDSEQNVDQSGEATNVSSEALTRLARQAALALEYLSMRGMIHRDIRASNCLVDVNRSLKLANFGMARMTTARKEDGCRKYTCGSRGIFPVLWMAPESLESGVFSTASDIWSLGVFALELVTFGARPYGDMRPERVREFVIAGGKPPIPRETSPRTMGLMRMCWQREAEQRPTATEVVAYLNDWPCALSPILDSDKHLSLEVDSGFGDSPVPDSLLPWSLNENALS